jgi:murein DD-endopeptidase MepM/ murein hydrolase activator NlpD
VDNINNPPGTEVWGVRIADYNMRYFEPPTIVSAGSYHTLVLSDDGTVWASGHNVQGQIGDGTNTDRMDPVQIPVSSLSNVVSVAAGVVVHAGSRYGYGEMVEVNHGGGFSTRYGHHQKLLVKAGDIVKKGQIVGLMGSSGRSTGPHVHFEVYKNGRAVDPSSYIHRASR